jgi:hypothetical protein
MMQRFSFLAAVGLLVLAATGARADDKKSTTPPYVHTVIFYLKADAPSGTADEVLADCHAMLAKIASVRLLKAGKSVEKAGPPTRTDYAVGLLVLFDDAEGFKAYATDPLHLKFVEKYRKYFDVTKLAVYDFVDAKK